MGVLDIRDLYLHGQAGREHLKFDSPGLIRRGRSLWINLELRRLRWRSVKVSSPIISRKWGQYFDCPIDEKPQKTYQYAIGQGSLAHFQTSIMSNVDSKPMDKLPVGFPEFTIFFRIVKVGPFKTLIF